MPDELGVSGRREGNVAVLEVSFETEIYERREDIRSLSAQLPQKYKDLRRESSDVRGCVVMIRSEVAGSSLIRGLFELYKMVTTQGGRLICVNFPADFVPSLTALGILDLPAFSLASDEKQAVLALQS